MMKKVISILLTLALALSVALTVTSCGDKEKGSDASTEVSKTQVDNSKEETEDESTAEEASEEEGTPIGKYASIKEYVESDAVQSQLEAMLSSMDTSTMKMDVYGEDNKLVYSYTYLMDLTGMGDIGATLDAALEQQASTFQSVASSLKLAVDVDNPVVVVKYLDKDGNEITSKEFTAN